MLGREGLSRRCRQKSWIFEGKQAAEREAQQQRAFQPRRQGLKEGVEEADDLFESHEHCVKRRSAGDDLRGNAIQRCWNLFGAWSSVDLRRHNLRNKPAVGKPWWSINSPSICRGDYTSRARATRRVITATKSHSLIIHDPGQL